MSETENQQKGTPRRPRINKMPFLVATLFIIVVVLVAFVSVLIKKYTPSKEQADLQEYYHLEEEDDMALVLDQQLLEETAKYWDGQVYMKFETVQQYFNQRFY